jgi:Fur family ferric uptake transcriptional regulator
MGGSADLDELLHELRHRGARVTTARRVVLAELAASSDQHPTADQLAARIQRAHPDVHLSTVYRTLEFLEGSGLVFRAGFGDGATTYHLSSDRHHHAVCDQCGAVIVLPDRAFDAVTNRLRRDHGFEAAPRHLTITGRCARCAAT